MIPAVGRFRGGSLPIPTLDLANLVDTSGNGKSLMMGGAHTPTFASNPFGIGQDGLIFDGVMNAAGYGPDWDPSTLTAYTYQFRIVRDIGHLGVFQRIFGRWDTVNGTHDFSFLCYIDNGDNLNFIVANTGGASSATQVSVGVINDGSPHAIQFSLNAGVLSAYKDGTLIQALGSVAVRDCAPTVSMQFGTFGDVLSANSPFFGDFGDFMWSNIARNTGSSYTVPTIPAVADANTLSLLPMSAVAGNYIETPAYQGNCLLRGSFAPAAGGWSNPDGPLPQIGGGWYFTSTGFDGSTWTVWGITASDLGTLLSGGGMIGALAIQTPAGTEGDLAGNGSVVPFLGQYWHFYHDAGAPVSVRYSTGSDLGAPFSPQPGNILFTGFFDPFVRVSADGLTLTMYMGFGSGTDRTWSVTTSTNGTTWTTPVVIIPDILQTGYVGAPGEFGVTNFTGLPQWAFSDGAPTGGTTRDVVGWGTKDGATWLPLYLRLTAAGTGNDAGGNPYIAVCDTSPTWDNAARHLIIMCTHSTNTAPTQPTDADIAVWFATIANT